MYLYILGIILTLPCYRNLDIDGLRFGFYFKKRWLTPHLFDQVPYNWSIWYFKKTEIKTGLSQNCNTRIIFRLKPPQAYALEVHKVSQRCGVMSFEGAVIVSSWIVFSHNKVRALLIFKCRSKMINEHNLSGTGSVNIILRWELSASKWPLFGIIH